MTHEEAIEYVKTQLLDEKNNIEALETLIPELKKSEDEKMKEAIIATIHLYYGEPLEDEAKQMIAWLEKQGEQNDSDVKDYNSIGPHFGKPIDKIKPKFKVGDWVVWDNKISCHVDNIYQGKESLMYTITDTNNMTRSYSIKSFDNNAHLWTIQDAKDGDVLVTDSGRPFIYKGLLDREHKDSPVAYCGIDAAGLFCTCEFAQDYWWTNEEVYPATKEQRERLFQKMEEAGYEWKEHFKLVMR